MSSQELSPVFPLREEPFALEPKSSPQNDHDVNFFRDITAYVEVRSQAENRSRAIAQELRDLGVTVSDRLGPNITHIVYRQGCRRTAQWAERHDVPLVSVSWIQACKQARKLLPTVRFPATETVDSASPGLHARRRMRSMQPKSFEEDLKLSSERKRRATRRNHRRNELRRRVAEAEQRLWSCENDGEGGGAKPDNYFADPHIYVAKTPPSMKEFVERRGRRYSIASVDSISPVCSPPKQLSLDSAAESTSKTPPKHSELDQPGTPHATMQSPRRRLNLGRTDASMEDTPSSFSSGVSQRSLLCPARKLFDASSFNGILIEPKTSSNRLQDMCSVFPKAFQKRKILGTDAANAQRKRNRHSEQPLTKSSFLFDDSGGESESDAKVDQEAATSRTIECDPTPEPAKPCFQEPSTEETPRIITSVTSAVSPSSSVASVSEADICALVRDCTRRDRRSRVSTTLKRTDDASVTEPPSSNRRKSSTPLSKSVSTSSPKKNNNTVKNPSPKKSGSLVKKPSSVNNKNSAADSIKSSTKSRSSMPSSLKRRSSSFKNDTEFTMKKLPVATESNSSIDSVSESSCRNNNNSTMTSLSRRMLDLMKRPSSSRRPTRASFAAFSSSSGSSPMPSAPRRLSARLQTAAARVDEEPTKAPQPPPKGAARRRSSARPAALPAASGTLSTSPTPPPPTAQSLEGERQWSCDVLEDKLSQEKAYGVLAPPASPVRRSKRVSAASVLESLICHDSPSSTASSASTSRRTRPSLDDFRDASSSSSSRRIRNAAQPKGQNLLRSKRNIVLTSLHKKQQNAIASAIRVLGGASLREKVVKGSTTHVITNWPLRRTLNLLRARLLGLPILRFDWLIESREAGRWLCEEEYLIKEVCDTETSSSVQNIFEECGSIFVSPQVTPPQRELMDIIKLAGGEIARTPENAQIIIKSSQDSSPAVDPKWVLDSVMACKALPLKEYLSQE